LKARPDRFDHEPEPIRFMPFRSRRAELEPFASRLLGWWARHGRHDLPWQHPRTPYRVWVSEIMLQQTRAETVIGYFQRFMARFPDVRTLAAADLDDVLALWSGLGYYARGRNLHAAAVRIVDESGGELPDDVDELQRLPGIGRSTAAAIRAQGFDRRAAILDGNVKRVLARHAGIDGWPGRAPVARALWAASESRTPETQAADYTQAIMDLGATLCTARGPRCADCPVASDCVARIEGRQDELPARKPRKIVPRRVQRYLVARDSSGRILLERRPPSGIWGGLWCLPEQSDAADSPNRPGTRRGLPELPPRHHALTHFRLVMHFDHRLVEPGERVAESSDRSWFTLEQALHAGLPRPIRALIEELEQGNQLEVVASSR
jgi:A/G-specific adenine glycosylase